MHSTRTREMSSVFLLIELCVARGACGHEVAQINAAWVNWFYRCSLFLFFLRSALPIRLCALHSRRRPERARPRAVLLARPPLAPLRRSRLLRGIGGLPGRSACFEARPEMASAARAAVLGGEAAPLRRSAARAPSQSTPARPHSTQQRSLQPVSLCLRLLSI